jgi:RNA polymerase sigma-70 factor, ECF subfamily
MSGLTEAPRAASVPVMAHESPTEAGGEFDSAFRMHYEDVYRYALVLTRQDDDAEDIAAEAFARALESWSRTGTPDRPLAWLFLVARRLATDRWRRARRAFSSRGWVQPSDGTLDVGDVEARLWLESLLTVLSPRQAEAMALRYQRDLSDADIGQILGLSASGVRSLVSRALDSLREHPEVWK